MAIGGFGEVMAAAFPPLRRIWLVPPVQRDAVGIAWEKKIAKTSPSPATVRFINSLPSLAAWGITALVLLPRLTFTVRWLRNRKNATLEQLGADRVDVFNPPPAPPRAPVDTFDPGAGAGPGENAADEEPAAQQPLRPMRPAPRASANGLTGGGYAGEETNEYASIDGSEAK